MIGKTNELSLLKKSKGKSEDNVPPLWVWCITIYVASSDKQLSCHLLFSVKYLSLWWEDWLCSSKLRWLLSPGVSEMVRKLSADSWWAALVMMWEQSSETKKIILEFSRNRNRSKTISLLPSSAVVPASERMTSVLETGLLWPLIRSMSPLFSILSYNNNVLFLFQSEALTATGSLSWPEHSPSTTLWTKTCSIPWNE